jgi:hypothetical protein
VRLRFLSFFFHLLFSGDCERPCPRAGGRAGILLSSLRARLFTLVPVHICRLSDRSRSSISHLVSGAAGRQKLQRFRNFRVCTRRLFHLCPRVADDGRQLGIAGRRLGICMRWFHDRASRPYEQLRYRPTSVLVGGWVSGTAAAFLMLAIGMGLFRRHRRVVVVRPREAEDVESRVASAAAVASPLPKASIAARYSEVSSLPTALTHWLRHCRQMGRPTISKCHPSLRSSAANTSRGIALNQGCNSYS